MRRSYLCLLAAALVALGGCGGSREPMTQTDDTTAIDPTSSPAAETVPTTQIPETTPPPTETTLSTTAETTSTETAVTTATETAPAEPDGSSDRALLEAVCVALWGSYGKDPETVFDGTDYHTYEDEIAFLLANAEALGAEPVGAIADEEDLIAKAREVFIARLGQEHIDRVEADHIERDGRSLAIVERTSPVYHVDHLEALDVWYISPCMPSGILEDGTKFATIYDVPPFLMIDGRDGRIVGCRF